MDNKFGLDFMERTKYANLSESDSDKGVTAPELDTPVSGAKLIDLPAPEDIDIPSPPFRELMENRRSTRAYSDQPLSLEQLSWLLWSAQGVQKQLPTNTLRTVPSAGGRHPLDTFLAIGNASGLEPGLYRYMALTHQLALVRADKDVIENLTAACVRKWIANAPLVFLWAAVPYRATWKYSERGWRYIFLDAGHACQNLYLACEAIGAGCCGVEAFDDDAMNKFLGLDGEKQFAVYMAPAGMKK